MWLLIDNYDSFSHILLDYLLQINPDTIVIQNDTHDVAAIIAMAPERIILSPGPKTPDQAGITMDVINYFYDKIPILGVCLGHQAIAQFLGAKVARAPYPFHGKTSQIAHNDKGIFKGLDNNFKVMRYHSLSVTEFEHTGIEPWAIASDDGSLMAFGHEKYPVTGIQFHPESVLTEHGLTLLKAWDTYFK